MPRASRNPAELLPPQDHLCLVGVPDRLQDRSALDLYHRAIHPVCSSTLPGSVSASVKRWKDASVLARAKSVTPSAGEWRTKCSASPAAAPLPIRDPAKQVPAEQEQFNQVDLGPGRETAALS